MLRKSISFVFAIFACLPGQAQFGVTLKYQINDFADWNAIAENTSVQPVGIFDPSFELALDYWFRLPDHRVEFFPEANFGIASSNGHLDSGDPIEYRLKTFGTGISTHIYPFDLTGDCFCPTFSKQGSFFSKSFFLRFGIYARSYIADIETTPVSEGLNQSNFIWDIGAGAGFDVGISDLFTLTPFVMMHFFPSLSWEGFTNFHDAFNTETPDDSTSYRQIQFGLRIGFRPDYLKSRR